MNWAIDRCIVLPTQHGALQGQLTLPASARGLIILAHADSAAFTGLARLAAGRHGVLSMGLLAAQELEFPDTLHNVALLTQRLLDVLNFVRNDGDTETLPVGLLSTAYATPAAIRTAVQRDVQVRALACLGGLIDLAGRQYLDLLAAPLLMLIEADDVAAAHSFEHAAPHFGAPHRLQRLAAGEDAGDRLAAWFWEHLYS